MTVHFNFSCDIFRMAKKSWLKSRSEEKLQFENTLQVERRVKKKQKKGGAERAVETAPSAALPSR